jgi:hypothetical protein
MNQRNEFSEINSEFLSIIIRQAFVYRESEISSFPMHDQSISRRKQKRNTNVTKTSHSLSLSLSLSLPLSLSLRVISLRITLKHSYIALQRKDNARQPHKFN